MSGSTLFYIAFAAVMVAILVIVGAALVLEAGRLRLHPDRTRPCPATNLVRRRARADLALRVGQDADDVPAEPGVARMTDLPRPGVGGQFGQGGP